MKHKLIFLAIVLSVFSISAVTQQPKPQQWEYKFDYKCNEKRANEYAAEGWEFVAVSEAGSLSNLHCVFKRQK